MEIKNEMPKAIEEKESKRRKNKKFPLGFLLGFFIIVAAAAFLAANPVPQNNPNTEETKSIGSEEAKIKIEKFINENLMSQGSQAAIKEITPEGDLYKVLVDIGNGQIITSYLTKDGQKFFPQVMDIQEVEKQKQEAKEKAAKEQEAQKSEMVKNDKPAVELFVMSHCPYGTQIEKGILPVLDALGDKIDFELKFCDYAMHGEKELDEELQQYCIQKEEPDKLISYLQCFLEDGKSEECVKKADVNASKLKTCISSTDKKYKVTEKYNDKSTWINGNYPTFDIYKEDNTKYDIQGSPNLVINGKKVSSARDSASLLNMICSSFTNLPEECGKQLSPTVPSAGFGFGESGSNTNASCN